MRYLYLLLLLGAAACNKSASPDITSNMVVNITFNGAATETVSGTVGTAHNIVAAPDHHGNASMAALFTPADSSVVDFGPLATASFSNNIFTISCWVNVMDTTNALAILSKRGDTGPWEYAITSQFNHKQFILDNWISNGQTSVYGTDPLSAAVPIQPLQWQHIAYVADGSAMRVYINGVLQAGTDAYNGGALSSTTAHLVIGNGGGYGRNYYFNGCIDGVKMYNRALSANDVKALALQ